VTSAVKPDITREAKYVIMYPWYAIGKVNNLVLVDVGSAAYTRNKTGDISSNWATAAAADKNVIYSGFQLIDKNPSAAYKGILPGCFIKLNADSYNGMFAFYNKYEDWLKDVQKMTQYASNDTQGKKLRFGISTSNQTVKGITGAEGYVDTSGKSKYEGFAKFNMRSKDYIFTTNKAFYKFKPVGDKAHVIADLFPNTTNAVVNTPAKMSNGQDSALDVGKNSPLSAGPKSIPFYGSEILRTS
jgi:hypothetical protein